VLVIVVVAVTAVDAADEVAAVEEEAAVAALEVVAVAAALEPVGAGVEVASVGAGFVVVVVVVEMPRVSRRASWVRVESLVRLMEGNILLRSVRGGTPGLSRSKHQSSAFYILLFSYSKKIISATNGLIFNKVKSQGADPPPSCSRRSEAGRNLLNKQNIPFLPTGKDERNSQTISVIQHV
jgi:hypothetical protein